MMTACCVIKRRCSKDVDIRCSLPWSSTHMPEMNGLEFATEVKRLKPQMPIVMFPSDDAIPESALNVVDAFVSKNEASHSLLPAITRICGENLSGFQETRITA